MKILKKVLLALGIIVAVIVVLAVIFMFRARQMVNTIRSAKLYDIDLSKVEDGGYPGEFGEFLVNVKLEVTVKDHRITGITIIDQRSGPGYEALETIDQIIAAQSVKIDGVSGATGSSRCIMLATQNALLQK